MKYLIACCLILFLCCLDKVTAQSQTTDSILVNAAQPLTKSIVNKTIRFLEWALDLSLKAEQQQSIKHVLIQSWQKNNQEEIKYVQDLVVMQDELEQLGDMDKNRIKAKLKPVLLENMQKNPDDALARIITTATKPRDDNLTSGKTQMKVGTDGFTGLYRMVRPKAININNSGYERGFYIEHIVFLPGGHVYWSLPPEGLLYFDPDIAAKAHPDDWGTYQKVNNEIHILRGPARAKYIMTFSGDRLNNPPALGKGSFRPVPSADGLILDGRYRRHASEPSLLFRKDGSFEDEGVFSLFGAFSRLDGSSYKDDGKGGSGKYVIEQNTLVLKYTDGRQKTFVFEAFPEELQKKPMVQSFLLQEQRMERVQ